MEHYEFDFEKLGVYRKSLNFISKIFIIVKDLPNEFKYSIGNNLIRAGMSISNNIAEGNGKRSTKERIRYFSTSLDSTRECISVFNVLFQQDFLKKQIYYEVRSDAREITNMLYGLIKSQA